MSNFVMSRSLGLAGATNFRDLGGYLGHGGRTLRWRRLFRSDHLACLTTDDALKLSDLGLVRVCDFRGDAERAQMPCKLVGVTVHSLPIEPKVVQHMGEMLASGHEVSARDTERLMVQTYRAFVQDNSGHFAHFFAHLLETDTPLVFHCTAGKDRTGFAAALILLALGVPRSVVMQDYLLSNDLFRPPQFMPARLPQAVLDVLWRVQEDFLAAALNAVEAEYGDVNRYLEQALGLSRLHRERLDQLYLED